MLLSASFVNDDIGIPCPKSEKKFQEYVNLQIEHGCNHYF